MRILRMSSSIRLQFRVVCETGQQKPDILFVVYTGLLSGSNSLALYRTHDTPEAYHGSQSLNMRTR